MANNSNNDSAKGALEGWLDSLGLGSLSTWAWNQMIEDPSLSHEQLLLMMYERPEFQDRFEVIFEYQQAGKPPLSVAEVLAYEQSVADIFHAAGLPSSFYDDHHEIQDLMSEDISVSELADRIEQGWTAVASAPDEVKAVFDSYFGPGGDAALASYFLDPDKALPDLLEAVATAEVGGAAAMLGFDVAKYQAAELVDFGVNFASAVQGFQDLVDLAPLFAETVGEGQIEMGGPATTTQVETVIGQYRGQGKGGSDGGKHLPKGPITTTTDVTVYNDLQAKYQGIAYVFGTDDEGKELVRRRLAERAAAFGGGGQAAIEGEGIVGLGSAE